MVNFQTRRNTQAWRGRRRLVFLRASFVALQVHRAVQTFRSNCEARVARGAEAEGENVGQARVERACLHAGCCLGSMEYTGWRGRTVRRKMSRASAKTQYLTLERLPCWYDVWHL